MEDFYIMSIIVAVALVVVVTGNKITMKIVDDPSNYGIGGGSQYNFNPQPSSENTLKMRVPPANFSGPPHLKALLGHCFKRVEESYKYEFCPFRNVSQHEQSLRWNPYSGILGVWQEWEIINNTFVAMVMKQGDNCGQAGFRQMKVILLCGNKTEVGPVTEPTTCKYEMNFYTPLVCHKHSLLVYPTLSERNRLAWDEIEGQLAREEITQQGYHKRLRRLFERVGYMMAADKEEKQLREVIEKENHAIQVENGDFTSLGTCNTEYQKLKKELEGLRALGQLNIGNENKAKEHEHVGEHDYPDYHRRMEDYDSRMHY